MDIHNTHRVLLYLGLLLCRFEKGSSEVRELGRYLKTKQQQDFQPYFLVKDSGNKFEKLKVCLLNFLFHMIRNHSTQDL
jgi:hypothetical protein